MEPPVVYPEIGERLGGRFRVVFGRGSGPNGKVFKALDMALDLPVAVKVFRPELFTSPFKDQNLFRLYRARAYQDPGLVRIYEVQEDRGFHFLTCQLMEGMSLAAILDLHAETGEHFTIPKIRAIMTRIFQSLEAIHATGAIHGNLKPQNIFMLPDRLALSDPYYLVSETLKEGQEIPVWDYYRGPEQLTDPSLEIKETDLYAVALIFGELVGGNPVQPRVALSEQVPRLTTRFDDLFVRATATDPFARPRTVREMRDGLMELLDIAESEGLWQRRYHETGSFRAIRLPAAREEPAARVEPVVEKPERAAVVAAPAAEPAPKPEAMAAGVQTPEPVRVEPPVPEEVALRAEPEPEPEAIEVAPVEEPAAVVEEVVAEPLPEPEPDRSTVPIPVPPPVPPEEVEGIVVSPEPAEGAEETEEGIEVLPEEVPPIPQEATEEGPLAEAPPIPAEAAIEAETVQMPEARDGTLEMETVAAAPAARMAPMQRVTSTERIKPQARKEQGPFRMFLMLLALFVVVGGATVYLVVSFSGSEETAPSEAPAVVAPRPPPQRPASRPAGPPAPAKVAARDAGPAGSDIGPSAEAGAAVATPPPAPTPPPTPPPPPKRPLAQMLRCPSGMAKVVLDPAATDDADPAKVAFCVDTHEYPGAGKPPKTGVSAGAAASQCKKDGKRLCTRDEWRAACGQNYPYGADYREGACNVTSGALKPSGSFADCVTANGVYDLLGNASEWASDGRVHGGDASSGAKTRCDTESKRLLPGPTNGFRCCANAEK